MSNRFKFNEHGVCINPDQSAKVGKDAGKLLDEINKLLPKQTYKQLELFEF